MTTPRPCPEWLNSFQTTSGINLQVAAKAVTHYGDAKCFHELLDYMRFLGLHRQAQKMVDVRGKLEDHTLIISKLESGLYSSLPLLPVE